MDKTIHNERYRKIIGRLKRARLKNKMTQEELAKKLNRHQSYIAKVEGFDRKLDVLEFITIAETLGYKPADLL